MIKPEAIEEAAQRIAPFIHRTPLFTNSYLDHHCEAQLYFKAENLQKTGSFKPRGAINSILKLSDKEAANGVATHSSGNHGQALAWAARQRGIPAYIVMPENAPAVKVAAVKDYGAEVIFCAPKLEAREETLRSVMEDKGAVFIPPYNYHNTIEGQATAAKEIFEELNDLDYLLVPVGGGGLLAGSAISAEHYSPKTKVLGCEPREADDAQQSFRTGNLIPANNPETVADGLRTSLGEIPFGYIRDYVDDIITCSEEHIWQAMRLIWERMKIVVEPSGAVALACVLEHRELFRGKKAALILSGGNVDLDKIAF